MNVHNIFKSKLIKNGMWLYALQFFNMVVPLFTLPYISRILGSAQYGKFSFALNIVGYFQVIVEYGFGLSGSRKVAIEDDMNKVERLFSRIIYCRIILCMGSFVLMFVTSCIIGASSSQKICMVILSLIALSMIFQQTWLFQGMECMQYITIVSMVSRILMLLGTFIFIHRQSDVYLYCAIYALSQIVNSTISMLLVHKKFNFKLKKTQFKEVVEELKDGWYTFTTSIMTQIFTGIGVTVLGVFGTSGQVGVYSAVQKVPMLLTAMYSPISQILYPYMSRMHKTSNAVAKTKITQTAVAILSLFGLAAIGIVFLRHFIVNVLFGSEYGPYSDLLIPLSIWMMLSILNNFLGIQSLVASGHLKEYSIAFNIGVIAIVISNLLFVKLWRLNGAAYASLVSEFILTVSLIIQVRKIKIIDN